MGRLIRPIKTQLTQVDIDQFICHGTQETTPLIMFLCSAIWERILELSVALSPLH